MKDFCRMKPLANNTSGTATANDASEINGKREAQLVAILNPDENVDQSKGWVCVVASKELPPEMEKPKRGTNKAYLGQLRFTMDQQKELLNRLYCPKKVAANSTAHEFMYIGKYFISGLQSGGIPLKIKCTSEQSKGRTLEFLRKQKCKFLVDELDDCSMILLPVAEDVIFDAANLEQDVSSGPPLSRTRGLISGAAENDFPLTIGLFLSTTPPPKQQWTSLMGCVATLMEKWFKKSKPFSGENGGSRKSFEFLKWITTKKHQNKVEEYCRGEGGNGNGNRGGSGEEKGKLLRIGGGGRKYHKNKNAAGQRKVKRIKFGGGNKGENHNAFEKKNAGETVLVAEDKQLIRIELKPDPLIQDRSFQFCSGDLLRLKLTMVEFPVDNGYEVDIDFLQNFMCETDALQSSCRSRRISKLVHRAIITDFNWERGVNISGQQFAVCWIPFRIPGLDPEENASDPMVRTGTLSLDKFKVASSQYELQIRLYKDDEQSHYILSASSFPLNIEIENKFSSLACDTTGAEDDAGDILQIFHEEEQPELEYLFGRDDDYSLMIRKSFSACEFDV